MSELEKPSVGTATSPALWFIDEYAELCATEAQGHIGRNSSNVSIVVDLMKLGARRESLVSPPKRSPLGFVRVPLYAIDCISGAAPSFVRYEHLFGRQIEGNE